MYTFLFGSELHGHESCFVLRVPKLQHSLDFRLNSFSICQTLIPTQPLFTCRLCPPRGPLSATHFSPAPSAQPKQHCCLLVCCICCPAL